MARYWEISKVIPIVSPYKTCDPRGGVKFDPMATIWALWVEAYYIKPHAKFGKPRPHGYEQRDF